MYIVKPGDDLYYEGEGGDFEAEIVEPPGTPSLVDGRRILAYVVTRRERRVGPTQGRRITDFSRINRPGDRRAHGSD